MTITGEGPSRHQDQILKSENQLRLRLAELRGRIKAHMLACARSPNDGIRPLETYEILKKALDQDDSMAAYYAGLFTKGAGR